MKTTGVSQASTQAKPRHPRKPGLKATACLLLLLGAGLGPAQASSSGGRIALAGDEWGFSDAQTISSNYIANVVKWFGLVPGNKVLLLDGQSWNRGYAGTYGAFGSRFRQALSNNGVAVTYRAYSDPAVVLNAYDAIFVAGWQTNYSNLPSDLVNFVRAVGAVFVAGGTGTFPVNTAQGEAEYWQPFFTAATGSSEFGLDPNGWYDMGGPLSATGPLGDGVTTLDWYMGQGVRIGNTPRAEIAMWSPTRNLVAIWSSTFEIGTQPRSQFGMPGGSVSFYVIVNGGTAPIQYQWFKDGGPIFNATNSNLVLTNLQASDEGLYTVVANDAATNTAVSLPASLTIQSPTSEIALYPGVKINGVLGLTYGIQATTNLLDTNSWLAVANVVLTKPALVWYDPLPATQPRRFYRVVPGPIPIP